MADPFRTFAKTAVLFFAVLGFMQVAFSLPATAKEEPSGIGYLLADDQGNILASRNSTTLFIPASILKILTSSFALETLGKEYRFKTQIAYDRKTGVLYLKGSADPLLTSEEIVRMCRHIVKKMRISRVNGIILDNSFFEKSVEIPGTGSSLNPYDAGVGALRANFNTVAFKWNVSTHRHISAEPQTPLLNVFQNKILATGLKSGRIILSDEDAEQYPGLLIQYFLNQLNVDVSGGVGFGNLDPGLKEQMIFESGFTLEDIIRKLLKFSNNFIANQLLLALGTVETGPPATLEKSIKAFRQFNRKKGFSQLVVHEGSGISRSNRITPEQMLSVLLAFKPHHRLLRENEKEYYKTGTLNRIRTRAGYLIGPDNRLYPYVIMLNHHSGSTMQWVEKFQDIILRKVSGG